MAAWPVGGTADLDLLRLVLRYTTEYPDRVHHPKEEVLFALVKRRDPRVAAVVDVLTTEHTELSGETARFTRLAALTAEDWATAEAGWRRWTILCWERLPPARTAAYGTFSLVGHPSGVIQTLL